MMARVIYSSNKKPVGDGMRITRVSGGGALFEVWTGSGFSPVELAPDPAAPVNLAPVGSNITLAFEVAR